MASVSLATAVANILFPAPIAQSFDDGTLSEHRRVIALGSLRGTFKKDKATLISKVVEASKVRGTEVSEDEAELALNVLRAAEGFLQDAGDLKPPGPGEDRDEFLAVLATIDRGENTFEEDNIRSDFDRFGVEKDVDLPDYLQQAIGSFSWTKGAHYSYDYPGDSDEGDGTTDPSGTGISVDDVMDPDQAALFAAMGMEDVVDTVKAAVAAGEDPLAQVRDAADRESNSTTTTGTTTTTSGTDRRYIHIPALPPTPVPSWVDGANERARAARTVREERVGLSALFTDLLLTVIQKIKADRKPLLDLNKLLKASGAAELAKLLLKHFRKNNAAWDDFGWETVDKKTVEEALVDDAGDFILTSEDLSRIRSRILDVLPDKATPAPAATP